MSFSLPPIYNFPPFFTKQPNKTTFEAQLRNWCQIVVDYCRHHRIWVLDLKGVAVAHDETIPRPQIELFTNPKIDRHLKSEFVEEIFEHMVARNMAAWYNTDVLNNYQKKSDLRDAIVVYWRTPGEWAQKILEFVEQSGNSGAILTMYELQHGDIVEGQEFKGIHSFVLHQALQVLVKQHRAQVMKDDNGAVAGVKIV